MTGSSTAGAPSIDVDRLWQIYDAYRNALLNKKYYGCRLSNLRNWDQGIDIAIAIGTPTGALGSLAMWQSGLGHTLWTIVLALAALLAIIKPFLQLPRGIERLSKLYAGHTNLHQDLRRLVLRIEADKELAPEVWAQFRYSLEREKELGPEDDPKPKVRLVDNCEVEVNKELPMSKFWDPTQ